MRTSVVVGLVALAVALAASAGCGPANGSCQGQLDICLRRAPPGAASSDCYAQYDQCMRTTQQPRAAEDDDGGAR